MTRLERVVKRVLDLLIASVALLVLLIPFVVVAALVKFDSKGPVFFRHTRVGAHGRSFRMWKFRTMVNDAEARLRELSAVGNVYADGPFVKIDHDPRITRLGAFLRKTSVDELPQLLNVVTGEMSLVGPRPLVAAEVEALGDSAEERQRVLPGITGLWQVSGRSSTTSDERLELDLEYVRRRGLSFDLRILLLTVPAVLWRRGAM
ncbi:sugar transferase [Phycicoccus flavus]|uniref:Sugar transferase n=1 Tax=Phycicoccus flavus TaxID=2502783 RepID=A0A8T6R1B5_9MICO|nr:sugar transferase [Phycicoccus flavus]NHA66595.1 sugar transferase [Phycicoccus flavus]